MFILIPKEIILLLGVEDGLRELRTEVNNDDSLLEFEMRRGRMKKRHRKKCSRAWMALVTKLQCVWERSEGCQELLFALSLAFFGWIMVPIIKIDHEEGPSLLQAFMSFVLDCWFGCPWTILEEVENQLWKVETNIVPSSHKCMQSRADETELGRVGGGDKLRTKNWENTNHYLERCMDHSGNWELKKVGKTQRNIISWKLDTVNIVKSNEWSSLCKPGKKRTWEK